MRRPFVEIFENNWRDDVDCYAPGFREAEAAEGVIFRTDLACTLTVRIDPSSPVQTKSAPHRPAGRCPGLHRVRRTIGAHGTGPPALRLLAPKSTIRALDKYLKVAPSAPEWRLELIKAALTSRVQMAELSQPLCTAVQIGLVDLFAAVGVTLAAVVGYSSGEIVAAYVARGLTAREAIIAAWQRGLTAAGQTRPGAMAAIGLGWEEVQSFLSPPTGAVTCENFPKSKHPTVTARLLKVDKAYHCYHMLEVGNDYSATIGRDLVGRRPGKPFFFSVTGKQEQDLRLDAAYWQRNLESPVLFRAAVSELLDHVDDVAFLEIGPHAALAGPIRQIRTTRASAKPGPLHCGDKPRREFRGVVPDSARKAVPAERPGQLEYPLPLGILSARIAPIPLGP
ncbi:polyketide synthase [Aspergillus terreus]|uniref:Polyketide synthase n=1 Tax=Aspergillus terreus TaxID=33178 RepID=A0A5M3Z9V9_ASPTE|nr:hypothetical protein ATETN484_0009060800 [Aspergillus terreus]GFF18059.1 polyketide synthase [Aspergillus terreus]